MTLTTLRLFKSGLQVAYRDQGTGNPLVLLHGVGMQSAAWTPQIETFTAQFRVIALAAPRTRVLAGSVEEGMITYVTRSRVFGFPDYTTLHVTADAQGSRATLYGRQRFGKLDFGVNSARIQGWLGAVEALK